MTLSDKSPRYAVCTRSRRMSPAALLCVMLATLLIAGQAWPQAKSSFGSNDADICYRESQTPLSNHGIRYCTRAIREDRLLNRDLIATYTNRGIIYSAAGRYQEALADHNEALLRASKIAPLTAKIHINRGNVFHRIREYEQALSDYDKALELGQAPLDAVYFNRALTLLRLKRLADARDSLEAGLRVNPNAWRIKRKLEELTEN